MKIWLYFWFLPAGKFNPFFGTGRRLDGNSIPPVYSSRPSDVPNVNSLSFTNSSSPNFARPSQGKLVFASNFYRTKEIGKVILLLLLNALCNMALLSWKIISWLPTNIIFLFTVGKEWVKTRATPSEATEISAFHWEQVFPKGLTDIKSKY